MVLGERDGALAYFGEALQSGYTVALLDAVPALASLRADARYRELVAAHAQRDA